MSPDPKRLVEDASRGDAVAVESLLERYLPGLQRYVRRNAGELVSAKESSSDLVQSVCREVLERLGTERLEYRGEAEFKQWLYKAAMLKIMNRHRFYRAEKRDAAREVSPPKGGGASGGDASEGSAFEDLFRTFGTPSQDAMLREELERFKTAFSQLSPEHQQIIRLAHIEALPHKDIALRLGITEAHSRVMLSRALSRLAKLGVGRQSP